MPVFACAFVRLSFRGSCIGFDLYGQDKKRTANNWIQLPLYQTAKYIDPLPDFFIAGGVTYSEMCVFFTEHVAGDYQHIIGNSL